MTYLIKVGDKKILNQNGRAFITYYMALEFAQKNFKDFQVVLNNSWNK